MRKLYRFLNRLFSIIPILWNNEDWDSDYALELFKWKLERIEKLIRTNDSFVGAQQKAKIMRICIELIDRKLSEKEDPRLKKLIKNNSFYWVPVGNEFFQMKDTFSDEDNRRFRVWSKLNSKKEEHEWNLLFKLLKKHMRHWWD